MVNRIRLYGVRAIQHERRHLPTPWGEGAGPSIAITWQAGCGERHQERLEHEGIVRYADEVGIALGLRLELAQPVILIIAPGRLYDGPGLSPPDPSHLLNRHGPCGPVHECGGRESNP